MKKVLLMAVAIAAFYSCSDDDSSPAPNSGVPLVTKITTDGTDGNSMDKVYIFKYDDKKRIEKVTVTGDVNKAYLFTYNPDDQVSTMAITGDSPGLIALGYDAFKRVNQFTQNGSTGAVNYNPVTGIYNLGSGPISFSFDDMMDLKTFSGITFNYDTAKKGGFANVASDYGFVSFFMGMMSVVAKKPTTKWVVDNVIYQQFLNEYNESGYVTHSIVSGETNYTIDYEYANL